MASFEFKKLVETALLKDPLDVGNPDRLALTNAYCSITRHLVEERRGITASMVRGQERLALGVVGGTLVA